MKSIYFLLLVSCFSTLPLWSAPTSLQDDLQSLKMEDPVLPSGVDGEKLYAVQTRSIPLKYRPEISLGVGNNFSPGAYVASQNLDASLRFYFSDRFYTGISGSYVSSKLTEDGQRNWSSIGQFPDIAPVELRSDSTFGYHLFYGKFRLSMDTVFYFDQYWALGGGMVKTDNGISENWSPAVVADAGFAFWFGKRWSVRLGLKDYFFNEVRRQSSGRTQHFVGHASVGFVLGGDSGV